MSRFPLLLTPIIHENLSVIMTFCYSHKQLSELMNSKFQGEWKYLNKCLFEVSPKRALKACYELALYLRVLDDEEDMTGYFSETKSSPKLGKLSTKGKPNTDLTFRDAANKILHSSKIYWEFERIDGPLIVCLPRESDKWERAEIEVVKLAAFCGQLMH